MRSFTARFRWLIIFAAALFAFNGPSYAGTDVYFAPAQVIVAPAPDRQDESTDAEFVLDVYDNLRTYFFNPASLNHVALFNAGLDSLAAELGRWEIEFTPERIGEAVPLEWAKRHFTAEFERAEELTRDIPGMAAHALAFSAAAALLGAVNDSHTYFIPPDLRERNNYSGIGALIKRLDSDFYYFDRVFPGSPAERAGLRRFDRLTAINGEAFPDNPREIVSLLRGEQGTVVELTIERGGRRMNFNVRRDSIEMPVAEREVLRVNGDTHFGYIRLSAFNLSALWEVPQYIRELQGADGLILDLRGNSGGLIMVLQAVAGLFLEENTPIMVMRMRSGERRYVRSDSFTMTNLPLVVLVDEGSASASEITAVAFQEAGRATIVGAESRGAVGAGQSINLPYGAGMMVTTAQIFSPSGRALEGDGVHPDVVAPLTRDNVAAGRDAQLEEAIEVLKQMIQE